MSYQNYIIAAYAVFAAVLLWDFLVPRLRTRQLLRNARQRAARAEPAIRRTARKAASDMSDTTSEPAQ